MSVAVDDLNGDGTRDFVTANLYANTISLFLKRGDGGFEPRRDHRAGGDPRAVAIGDLNGDGEPDLAAVSSDANALSVFLNRGDGSFRQRRDYETEVGPLALAIADLDGDGKNDVATVGRSYALSVMLNSGNGRFKLTRRIPVGAEPVSLALADLNGDRKPDVVTANAEASTVSVLLNRGGGRFRPKRDLRTGHHPMSVAIGNVNGDGKPDLATANLDDNTISLFLNRGDGSFKRRRDYRAGGDPRGLAIGDLNGDGKPDIAAVNADASTVSVLMNRGGGTLRPRRDSPTGRHPVAVSIADLTDDSRPEALTANLDAGTVSVLRAGALAAGKAVTPPAQPPPPPAAGLLLWNTLGSAYEVMHSPYGPDLVRFDCKDPSAPYFRGRCSVDVSGNVAYRQGVYGGAATIGDGPYFSEARVHAALLRASLLNPEHGAVEAWYRQEKNPAPLDQNDYRILGGPYSLVGIDEVNLYASDGRLHFALFFGEEPPPFVAPHLVEVHALDGGAEGYPAASLRGRWVHVAGVWDRKGIGGTTDTVRLYVDGTVVASAKAHDWGTTPCGRRVAVRPGGACFTDIAGCNDTCANAFAVDNLKIWNYAKTDYSDRFREEP